MYLVFDLESDGLLEEVTKIHCLSYCDLATEKVTTVTSHEEIRALFKKAKVVIGHNIVAYDLKVLKKIIGIDFKGKVYDTLFMSWVFEEEKTKHGLEEWGEFFGIPKPKIRNWKNLPIEDYTRRCEEDVKINLKLWNHLIRIGKALYDDKKDLDRFLTYLTFKAQCAAEQYDLGWRLDIDKAKGHLKDLKCMQEELVEQLRVVMPRVKVYKTKTIPKIKYKKDGTFTKNYQEWVDICELYGRNPDTVGDFKILAGEEEPNPNSHEQVKAWLFSLGWEPCTFDHKKSKSGVEKSVPQVRKFGELTSSVLALADENDEVKLLADLSMIQHRIGVFEGMLEEVNSEGFLRAEIGGLTNTFRFKHKKPIVNLPGVDKFYGKEIRSVLIAPSDDTFVVGADMTSLEATTKAHYIYPYDPEYALELTSEGFDEHLDLAQQSKALTPQQVQAHKDGREDHSKTRKMYKPVNYSAVYGVGAKKLSREMRVHIKKAQDLLDEYWKRNWAVKKLAEDLLQTNVKTVNKRLWLLNPVSKFWYPLRFPKDVFSTLNQGTGVFCFDTWVAACKQRGVPICAQFHDEIVAIKGKNDKKFKDKLYRARDVLNEHLTLNVKLDIDVKEGRTYAEVH